MRDFNWSGLTSPQFEALVQTLVFYKDPKAYLFNRPGPDGAQDALSGDGQTVYQAKYHPTNTQSSNHAFSDAVDEYNKIKKYKSENDPRWETVRNWVLAAPVTFGSQDYERWNREIVPLFNKIGLQADIWPSSALESEIIQRPELKEVFFEGTNRCFLSLPEFRNSLLDDRLGEPGIKIDYVGRYKELETALAFLNDYKKRFLPVIGQAGIGKTRFLLECGYKGLESQSTHQVLWAQIYTLSSSEHWFKATATHIPTLVLLDGLDTLNFRDAQKILLTFREQILTPKSNWKVIIVVPSVEWLDGIMNTSRFLSDSDPIEIKQLTKDEAKKMAQGILTIQWPNMKGSRQEKISEDIATHSNAIPLWIVAETCILSETGDLIKSIKDPYGIATSYLKNSLKLFKENEIEDILFWVSMYQPVQKADQNFLKFVSLQTHISVEKIESLLSKAEDQKIIHSYGVSGRYIKIVPQGLADNVIYKKFLLRSEKPSQTALKIFDELIINYEKIFEPQKMLHALGKMSFHSDVFRNILNKFSETLIKNIKSSKDVSALKKYFELAKPLAIYIPDRHLEVISEFRKKEKVPNKTLRVQYLPPYTLTYKKEIQFHLARTIYDSSFFAYDDKTKEKLLDEMILLCEQEFEWFTEQEIERRNNEDIGCLRKLSDILFMESPYLQGYQKVARELALYYLDKIKSSKLDSRETRIAESILKPQLKVERRTTYWFDDKIVWESRPIYGFIDETRKLIVARLQTILKMRSNPSSLKLCLSLLSKAHHEANDASLGRWLNPPSEKMKKEFIKEIHENLKLIFEIFKNLSLDEKEIAQKIWNWHLRFDKREVLKKVASKCEKLRQKNLSDLDLSIFSFSRFDREPPSDIENRINKLAKNLSEKTTKEIFEYLSEALTLESSNHSGEYITRLAQIIGQNYFESPNIQKYIMQAISSKNIDGKMYGHFQISIVAIASKCSMIRKKCTTSSQELIKLISSYTTAIRSEENRIKFLYNFYEDRYGSILSKQDSDLILKAQPLFIKKKSYPSYFYLLGKIFLLNSNMISKTIESLWSDINPDLRQKSYEALLNGLGHNNNLDSQKKWLFEQTLWINDPDHLEHIFRFTEIFRDWKCSLIDFYQIILKRLKMKPVGKRSDYKVLPDDEFLKWVEKIDNCSDKKTVEITIAKFLKLDSKKNWEIKYYLPKVMAGLDPHGVILPSIVARKIIPFKSIESTRDWVRYAGYYVERTQPWNTIVLPVFNFIKNQSEEIKNSIYSLVCKDAIGPTGWVGSAKDAWSTRLKQAETEFENEKDERLHEYLQWKVDCVKHQMQHFTQWEEED